MDTLETTIKFNETCEPIVDFYFSIIEENKKKYVLVKSKIDGKEISRYEIDILNGGHFISYVSGEKRPDIYCLLFAGVSFTSNYINRYVKQSS